MKKGIVISDLHLLSGRSEGRLHFEKLTPRLFETDTLVLNGDIFDFRWAIRPHSESVPIAMEWLLRLRSSFPHLEIHFVPGNHDCLPTFLERIEATDGISLHPHHLVLGRNLFLHGDAATYRMNENGFQKFRLGWEKDRPRGRRSAQLYALSDSLKLSDLTHHLWFGRELAIRRIIWHLEQTRPGWKEEVDECFFGHTHIPVNGVEIEGVKFFNTGSALRGQRFFPVEFSYRPDSTTIQKGNEI